MIHSKKKALLVGIQYDEGENNDEEGTNALRGPHYDVAVMKDLLVDYYEYTPSDIVVLIDRDEPGQVQPTHANMIQEIQKLVEDARPGDHFFFHYAGHTENIEDSEEDGVDECLIPSNGEKHVISGNELRRYLVDTLPIGSNLVAVFDCASGLDLEHCLCNRVHVPWISKRKRRSDSHWNANAYSRTLTVHTKSQRMSIDELLQPSRAPNITTKSTTFKLGTGERHDCIISASPCTGWCPPMSPHKANVISLAACEAGQLPWEDWDGSSMTKALINALRNDPHPRFVDLLSQISHELHDTYLRSHGGTRECGKEVKDVNRRRVSRGLPLIRMTNALPDFQDPQISSHRPLDRDAKWNP